MIDLLDHGDIMGLIIVKLDLQDGVRFGEASKPARHLLHTRIDMVYARVMSEVRPYVLRTALEGEEISRYVVWDHMQDAMAQLQSVVMQVQTDSREALEFQQGLMTVSKRALSTVAESRLQRREYIARTFRGADDMSVDELAAVVSELEAIEMHYATDQHTRVAAAKIRESFSLVQCAKETRLMQEPDRSISQSVLLYKVGLRRASRLCR